MHTDEYNFFLKSLCSLHFRCDSEPTVGILLLQVIFLKWAGGKQMEHIISLFLLF